MCGAGKVILQQSFKGSERDILEEVWYAPHAVHRPLSVNMLMGQGYRCVIKDQESKIWDASGALVIWVIASSPKNNLHWFQSRSTTPDNWDCQSFDHGSINSLVKEDSYNLWHQRFGHLSRCTVTSSLSNYWHSQYHLSGLHSTLQGLCPRQDAQSFLPTLRQMCLLPTGTSSHRPNWAHACGTLLLCMLRSHLH